MKNRIIRLCAVTLCTAQLLICAGLLSSCGQETAPTVQGIVIQDMAATYEEDTVTAARAALYRMLYGIAGQMTVMNEGTKESVSDGTDFMMERMQAAGLSEAVFAGYFNALASDTDVLLDEFSAWYGGRETAADAWAALYARTLRTFGPRTCAAILYEYIEWTYDLDLASLSIRVQNYRGDKYLYPYYSQQLEETKTNAKAFSAIAQEDFVTLMQSVFLTGSVLGAWNDVVGADGSAAFSPAEVQLVYDEMDLSVRLDGEQWTALLYRMDALPGDVGRFFVQVENAEDGDAVGTAYNALLDVLQALQETEDDAVWENLLYGDTAARLHTALTFAEQNAPAAYETLAAFHLFGDGYVQWLARTDKTGEIAAAVPVTFDAFLATEQQDRPAALQGLIRGIFD